ncbi:hypothetical protein KOI35_32670 [Actinoplanes bogorensis]|uniref:Secreted protein n=1 Tax=Paractinoplanes bogorensis TaxID=1610840 RepID=A0ABS5YXV5_9ACTN|nr:hypothetical protein [Actinoplanes bogorensis]MBU2668277.1 hypothetical protein [Actinoplanes bogorensis]
MVVLLSIFLLGGALLAPLGMLARRQHDRAGETAPVLAEPIEDLAAEAEAVGTAAQRAQQEADEVRHRADVAEWTRDQAEYRYREAQYGPRPDGQEPSRLVERAALDAYGRGELSASQLDAIWQQVPGADIDVRDDAVRNARQLYERAVADAANARQQAYVAGVAAEVLAEEQRAAAGELSAARQSAGAGLPSLFAP